MPVSASIRQSPSPGSGITHFTGDTQTFTLTLDQPRTGRAFIRTNIGQARRKIREILDQVDKGRPLLDRDWFDIPMKQKGPDRFEITLGLCETGHFNAKCYFLPEHSAEPVWPRGDNISLNVSAAHACCANVIYNAFVRQFGPNRSGTMEIPHGAAITDLDQKGWAVIPPSGRFRDLIRELDFIIDFLGCRYIQLLPVHPTPTTYGRMGRFGSPYAALDFMDVDPALAEFDPKATPMQQFLELVDEIHCRDARILLDIAINHTGWAASLHESHPQWLSRTQDGRIENPGAWGVKWEDLTKLDFSKQDLWQYMAEVFLRWCKRGVDGFRGATQDTWSPWRRGAISSRPCAASFRTPCFFWRAWGARFP